MPCAQLFLAQSSQVRSMVKKVITQDRLVAGGKSACQKVVEAAAKELNLTSLPEDAVVCEYLGTVEEGAPLKSVTRVNFRWTFRGELFEGSVPQETQAAKALHAGAGGNGLRLPWEAKLPLRVTLLPSLIVERKLVQGMANLADVRVHGLAVPKEHTGEQDTALVLHAGRLQEFLKVAPIAETMWLCHPGGVLSPNGLVQLDIPDGPPPKEPRGGPIYRLPRIQQGELLHKLYAVAHFRAENLRAKMEGRAICLQTATERFKVDAMQWGHVPRNVFVIWSYRTPEGTREYELSELPYKGIR